jgi:uncharacterized protein
MSARPANKPIKPNYSAEIIQLLNDGVKDLLANLQSVPKAKLQAYYIEIENIHQFLHTLNFIRETMSTDILLDTLHNSVHTLRTSVKAIPQTVLDQCPDITLDPRTGIPDFLLKSIHLLGPHIRTSKSEMAAWITLNANEADLFSPELILHCLHNLGITKGIMQKTILDIFEKKIYDTEVCVAKGLPPTLGEDGRIEYLVNIQNLSVEPKELSLHKVSFKDIKLYEYIKAGDVLVKTIPPKPGTPGYTVTNRILPPVKTKEAVLPDLKYTRKSEDDTHLIVEEDCCIKKKAGGLYLEPSLRIMEDVSYKTGNIASKVAVIVEGDVFTGFTLKSDKGVHISGILDGAELEASGNIIIRGGIQGKEKAIVDTNGDLTAKFISNATTNALGDTIVQSEIVNSHVWSGGRVLVTGHPGTIVGGEVQADSDIVANSIGSEIGTKTILKIGGRTQDLAIMIQQTQTKMAEQEESVDKCNQIIDFLRMRESQTPLANDEITKSKKQAQELLQKANENLQQLHLEYDNLQKQYDDSLQKSRTVRAKINIFPGTEIEIQGTKHDVKTPTGPVMFIKQGNEIVQFPYREL